MSEIALQKMLILPSFDFDRIPVRGIYLADTRWTPNKNETGAWKEPVASSVGSSHPLPVFGNDAQAAPRFAFATVNLFTGTLRPR
jgi:hypothetical protein